MNQVQKYARFLQTLTKESWMYAIFGRGYPHSFYKAYVRANNKSKWWRVKHGGYPVSYCPRREALKFPPDGRLGAIDAPIGYFLLYEHIGHPGLSQLCARIVELRGEVEDHLQIMPGPPTIPGSRT